MSEEPKYATQPLADIGGMLGTVQERQAKMKQQLYEEAAKIEEKKYSTYGCNALPPDKSTLEVGIEELTHKHQMLKDENEKLRAVVAERDRELLQVYRRLFNY